MSDETAEIINDLDGLTLGHLFQIARKVKVSALISIFAILSSLFGGVYALGRNTQEKHTAVMLDAPFGMALNLDSKQVRLDNLVLIKDPMASSLLYKDVELFSLRQIVSDFDIVQLGTVAAKVNKQSISWPWSMFAGELSSGVAHAADNFSWNGHAGDFNYTEKFIDEDTVHRFYSDGCVLGYKVDDNRRSIPSSFRWIKSVH